MPRRTTLGHRIETSSAGARGASKLRAMHHASHIDPRPGLASFLPPHCSAADATAQTLDRRPSLGGVPEDKPRYGQFFAKSLRSGHAPALHGSTTR